LITLKDNYVVRTTVLVVQVVGVLPNVQAEDQVAAAALKSEINSSTCAANLTRNRADFLILLFSSPLSFFPWSKLGLFLFFPLALVFTSPIAHVRFSSNGIKALSFVGPA
jgi:hypothetical protein